VAWCQAPRSRAPGSRPRERDGPSPLRRWRERTGRSVAWLSGASGVSLRTLTRVTAGAAPSAGVALALAEATGIPVEDLLRGAP